MNAGRTGQDQSIKLGGASPLGKTSGDTPAKSTSSVAEQNLETGVRTEPVVNNATVTSTIDEQNALNSHQVRVAEESGVASAGSNPTSH